MYVGILDFDRYRRGRSGLWIPIVEAVCKSHFHIVRVPKEWGEGWLGRNLLAWNRRNISIAKVPLKNISLDELGKCDHVLCCEDINTASHAAPLIWSVENLTSLFLYGRVSNYDGSERIKLQSDQFHDPREDLDDRVPSASIFHQSSTPKFQYSIIRIAIITSTSPPRASTNAHAPHQLRKLEVFTHYHPGHRRASHTPLRCQAEHHETTNGLLNNTVHRRHNNSHSHLPRPAHPHRGHSQLLPHQTNHPHLAQNRLHVRLAGAAWCEFDVEEQEHECGSELCGRREGGRGGTVPSQQFELEQSREAGDCGLEGARWCWVWRIDGDGVGVCVLHADDLCCRPLRYLVASWGST